MNKPEALTVIAASLATFESAKGIDAYSMGVIEGITLQNIGLCADAINSAEQARKDASANKANAMATGWQTIASLAASALGRVEVAKAAKEVETNSRGQSRAIGAAGVFKRLGFPNGGADWSKLLSAREYGVDIVREGRIIGKTALEQTLKALKDAEDSAKSEAESAKSEAEAIEAEQEAFKLNGTPTRAMVAEAQASKAEGERIAALIAEFSALLASGNADALAVVEKAGYAIAKPAKAKGSKAA